MAIVTEADLKSIRADEEEIARLKQRIADLRSNAQGLTQTISDMPRSGQSKDRMAEYAAQMEHLQKKFGEKVVALAKKRLEIDEAVELLPEQQKRVIRLRYYDRMSWRRISRVTHYTEQHCRKIKAAGIKRLENAKDVR